MPRPSNPEVRRRLLEAGLNLVHARGFAASGVKDITDAAGVPKGSFYAYFPSKEALAEAILEHYWSDIQARLLPILHEDGLAQERITRFFHALADDHEAGDFLLGCLIGTAVLTGSVTPSRIRENFDVTALPESAIHEINEGLETRVRFNSVVDAGQPGFAEVPQGS